VAAAAVHVARRAPELQPSGLAGRMAIVLGAGAMAKSAVQALLDGGAQVTILNRTPIHAERLAREVAGSVSVAPLDALPHLLPGAAVLVGATAARQPVVDIATVQAATVGRSGPPLIVLDVAVPRDVEPSVRFLPGVRLIDLDDLERYCPADLATQRATIQRAESLAVEEAEAIEEWLRVRAVSPAIAELRRRADEIRALELRRAAARLRDLTPEQQAAVDQLTESIVNKLLHGPTVALREAATRRSGGARSREIVLGALGVNGDRHRRR
jgi:glutamyl-tRNA reductase